MERLGIRSKSAAAVTHVLGDGFVPSHDLGGKGGCMPFPLARLLRLIFIEIISGNRVRREMGRMVG